MSDSLTYDWKQRWPQLSGPTPRRVRPGAVNNALRLAALILLAFGAASSSSVNQRISELNALQRSGLNLTGTAVSHIHRLGREETLQIKFNYELDSKVIEGIDAVDENTYRFVKDGEEIALKSLSGKARMPGSIQKDLSALNALLITTEVVFIGAALLLEYACRRYGRKERALVRHGRLEEATLISAARAPESSGKGKPAWELQLEVKHKGKNRKIKLTAPAALCSQWEPGRKVPLLINPNNPEDILLFETTPDKVRLV